MCIGETKRSRITDIVKSRLEDHEDEAHRQMKLREAIEIDKHPDNLHIKDSCAQDNLGANFYLS